ncbi:hypothetical protein MHYP_G00263130 [Metynnis hypsauchen]
MPISSGAAGRWGAENKTQGSYLKMLRTNSGLEKTVIYGCQDDPLIPFHRYLGTLPQEKRMLMENTLENVFLVQLERKKTYPQKASRRRNKQSRDGRVMEMLTVDSSNKPPQTSRPHALCCKTHKQVETTSSSLITGLKS